MKAFRASRILTYVSAVVAVLVFAGPFLYMLLASFKQPQELNGVVNDVLPKKFYLTNYTSLFESGNFLLYFVNSAVIAVVTTVLALFVAILAGYALARFKFAGKRLLLLSIVSMQMFPAVLMAVPLYKILRSIGLLDARNGLVLVYVTFALPFCVWMMRNYFLTVPVEIEEAALIDGCGHFRALWRVLLPMRRCPASPRPAPSASSWCGMSSSMRTPSSTPTRSGRSRSASTPSSVSTPRIGGSSSCGGVLMTLPVVLIFAFLQRYLTQIAGGGVKG